MSDTLLSLGLDVGTTSTQLIFSELRVENRAGSFSVPEMAIVDRRIRYKSVVHFTPLLSGDLVDAAALRAIIQTEYEKAGIRRDQVDTGALIITGETSRKENAEAVLHELSGFAGDFVVATAGPDLESVLAAKGAGADAYSRRTGKTLLHMDIGGGTSNLALIREGRIVSTGCLNVGGRLLKFDGNRLTYRSPVLEGLCHLRPGDPVAAEDLEEVCSLLVSALEMAAGLTPPTSLLEKLTTSGTAMHPPAEPVTLSFSGGVADCISREIPWDTFGDVGPILGRAIRCSKLCRGDYLLGEETIRATVIGAGCHSAQLSGSTVFHQNIPFPLKNLPVVPLGSPTPEEGPFVLAIPLMPAGDYAQICRLADRVAKSRSPYLLCLEQDMAKALGQALALRLPPDTPILCIDRIRLPEGSYLDVAAPLGPALPVVVKTLVLSR